MTHVLLVLAPVLFPLCHVIKARGKLFASNPLNDLFAAVTDNFNRFDSRARRGFNCHTVSFSAAIQGRQIRWRLEGSFSASPRFTNDKSASRKTLCIAAITPGQCPAYSNKFRASASSQLRTTLDR